jgi:hypothetical protein
MFRKFALVLGTTVTIGTAALIPTSASAHGHHGHWHGGFGWGGGIYAPLYVSSPDCYIVKRVVDTPLGLQVRRITVCN